MNIRELMRDAPALCGVSEVKAKQLAKAFDLVYADELQDKSADAPFSLEACGTTRERFYFFRLLLVHEARDKVKATLICEFLEAVADNDLLRLANILKISEALGISELVDAQAKVAAAEAPAEVWN